MAERGRGILSTVRARRGGPDDVPQLVPAGEFYSPIVHAADVLAPAEAARIWPAQAADPPGIDLRPAAQLALLDELAAFRFDHRAERPGQAYDPTNEQFPPQDAALLYALLRLLRPARMVEIGSGWSTTVALAAIDDGATGTALTCVEPYPRDFLRAGGDRFELRVERVEHTPAAVFEALGPGDVCFIDSSHVAKTGSDVVHLLLDVVPRLADGVVVHVHDIFLPEDYPREWIRQGFNWNELYVLRAFLVGNARAHVLALNRWLALRHPDATRAALGVDALHGSSAWFTTGPEPWTVPAP